jgi:hypothetical protein
MASRPSNPTLDCWIAHFRRVRGDVAFIGTPIFISAYAIEEIPMRKDEVSHSMSFISA